MAGTSLGSLKGWGTRLIRKKNPELTFDMAVGILIEKYKSKSANDLREALINEFGVKPRAKSMNPAEFLIGVGDDPVISGIQAGAKKGGRIMKTKRGGKAVRGFAKKKKQANKMRKK